MIELMEKEGYNIPEECDYDNNCKGDNSMEDDDSDNAYD